MTIRKCEIEDMDAIKKVVSHSRGLLHNNNYTYWMLLYNFGDTCYIAQHHNEKVGFISGMKNCNRDATFFIWQLGVLPKYRRKGYATKLIRAIIRIAKKQKCRKVHFTIEATNHISEQVFYNFAKLDGYQLKRLNEIDTGKFLYEMIIHNH